MELATGRSCPRPTQEVDTAGKQWVQVTQAVSAGVPIETALDKIMGWDAEDMDEMAAQQQAAFLVGNEQ